MKTYSSTILRHFTHHCPLALDFYEKEAQRDTDIFQVGQASHAVLEHVGKKNAKTKEAQKIVADAVVKELITTGHTFYDRVEPPMQPDHAFDGRDLALEYLAYNKLPTDGVKFEMSLGMSFSFLARAMRTEMFLSACKKRPRISSCSEPILSTAIIPAAKTRMSSSG